ncbi:MAG: hypothetical protein A3C07_00080 [Candidatus Sungbacteria bacterium RIFCSPHIGHO2_02_FULL_47_11]|uniref:Serine/threonine specific protein phosphatases domain-containing protein n=1 Tax=Candidatus Sungbacteria bacterium RIFCSPHIGHO2_02_FULL_47_11 TaxID=1802270 RepID=A0A1G2KL82_9BACT|nr:MAG: hypothetical protein A3C07_00080 [Candidatus Sungbacteria bacterium RIFCSPHIGHO2_02_FULL_47_11]
MTAESKQKIKENVPGSTKVGYDERTQRDKDYSSRYWERLRDKHLDTEAIKLEMRRDIQGMVKQIGEIRLKFKLESLSEEDKEKMSTMRRMAEEMGFKVGNFSRDVDSGLVAAKVEGFTKDMKREKEEKEPRGDRAIKRRKSSLPSEIFELADDIPSAIEDAGETLEALKESAARLQPEKRGVYEHSLDFAMEILEKEKGIVELAPNVPTIVVSDIHARRDFIIKLLERELKITDPPKRVFDLLKQGKINIVCVGDGMHSEKPLAWAPEVLSYDENGKKTKTTSYESAKQERNRMIEKIINANPRYQKLANVSGTVEGEILEAEIYSSFEQSKDPEIITARENFINEKRLAKKEALNREMARGLGLMKMVMDLKLQYPHNFHFLRGNHEDVDGDLMGDFKKGDVLQSEEVRSWLQENFGADFIAKWAKFEDTLPLLAKGKNIVVTHAAPAGNFTREQIESRDRKTTIGLNWTENRQHSQNAIPENKLRSNMKNILANIGMTAEAQWFIGHRPTYDLYRAQCNGQLIQINDDRGYVVAFMPIDGKFDPKKHITDLRKS